MNKRPPFHSADAYRSEHCMLRPGLARRVAERLSKLLSLRAQVRPITRFLVVTALAACGDAGSAPSRCTGSGCGSSVSDANSVPVDASDGRVSADPVEEVKVAFVGDLGVKGGNATNEFKGLLKLANQEADLLVLSGDMIYDGSGADDWHAAMQSLNIPYIAAEGNHDTDAWNDFKPLIAADISSAKSTGLDCSGDTGTKQTCTYKGVFFVVSGIGTAPDMPAENRPLQAGSHVTWMTSALAAATPKWKVCTWHKNHRQMQVGDKSDEVGWAAYQACQDAGAIVATAHEHSYGRTKTLTAIGSGSHGAVGTGSTVAATPGKTFVFHSGMGGNNLRTYSGQGRDWFASYFADNDQYMRNSAIISDRPSEIAGLLILTFNVGGDASKAKGEFHLLEAASASSSTVRSTVVDAFDITDQ